MGTVVSYRTIIVVDVQPTYCHRWDSTGELMEMLSDHDGAVVMLVNAEQDGLTPDTVDDCRIFWSENGLRDDLAEDVEVVDKGYGHLRAWMDLDCHRDVIVAVLRHMIEKEVTDSRDLDEATIRVLTGDSFRDWMLDDPLVLGWIPDQTIAGWSDVLICGGNDRACLDEVELLLSAHGVGHERIDRFVYDLPCEPMPEREPEYGDRAFRF